jgi:Bacterial SH3 domain
MIRQAAAVIIVLLLSPSWVTAQGTELTVSVSSASVHKSPSTASPVIGHAARGAHLKVTREVGDWVKVAWPAAPDGVGYVRVSVGSVANGTAASAPIAGKASVVPAPVQSTPRVTNTSAVDATQTGNRLPVRNAAPSAGTSHMFGVGALMGGPAFGLGVSTRVWSHRRLGVGFALSRYEISNPIDLGSMTSTEFGPSVLFSFNDHVADYTWLRPYLGAGMNFYRSTINSPVLGADMSDSRYGSQLFGGGELSFASVPQFAISTELSYRWFNAPSAGYELGGVGLSVAGHWYVK